MLAKDYSLGCRERLSRKSAPLRKDRETEVLKGPSEGRAARVLVCYELAEPVMPVLPARTRFLGVWNRR